MSESGKRPMDTTGCQPKRSIDVLGVFGFGSFEFVSDFVLRISDFTVFVGSPKGQPEPPALRVEVQQVVWGVRLMISSWWCRSRSTK